MHCVGSSLLPSNIILAHGNEWAGTTTQSFWILLEAVVGPCAASAIEPCPAGLLALWTPYPAPGDACRATIRFDLPFVKEWEMNGSQLVRAGWSFLSVWGHYPCGCAVLVGIEFVAAAGRPLDLAAAVKPANSPAKSAPSHD